MVADGDEYLSMLRRSSASRQRFALGLRGVASSPARFGGGPPFLHVPPPPPPEFMPDGSPKKYPLHQPIWEHGYDWEHWSLQPAGVFHTVYWGDFAQDYSPYMAFIQKFPIWVGAPFFCLAVFIGSNIFQNMGSIGIKPKRYTVEWEEAQRERERAENTNPVTRYLDRRRSERGWNLILGNVLPYNPYFYYVKNSHDWDYLESKGIERPEGK